MSIGFDMRELKLSITHSLCNQIFTLPIHWSKATNLLETVTHAIDFGPSGLSGIGPLTARNFNGCSVHFIILGDKGKGEAELFNLLDIQYNAWKSGPVWFFDPSGNRLRP